MQKIRKGDKVVVISGKDKGKQGEVLRVVPKDNRAVVQGANMMKKHQRATRAAAGGIVELEAPIHCSNLAHVDPKTNAPTRVGVKVLDDGRKVRFAKKSGEIIDR